MVYDELYYLFVCLLQSESNVKQLLISDPKDALTSYGLTDEGKRQAKEVITVVCWFSSCGRLGRWRDTSPVCCLIRHCPILLLSHLQ